jgi:MarR family transcriptional regulator, organic hydroperoxide resistance regulator
VPKATVSRPDELTLDEALCFALYSASRALTGFYRPLLDELGITYPQYLVLLALWERDGVAVGALTDRLRLDYGTLSPLLKRLQAAGLITRERRADDERSVTISLTEAGRALRARADCIPREVIAATGLDAPSFEELRETLQRLTATVNAASLTAASSAAASSAAASSAPSAAD